MMRFAFLSASVLCATSMMLGAPAFADELVAVNGSDEVHLLDHKCSSEQVLQRLSPRWHELLRDATAVVQGQNFRACWILDGDAAHLLYEDGDQGLVPLTDFRQNKQVNNPRPAAPKGPLQQV